MIYDWYNGGDWGGLPVRRLGHIMADIINAVEQARVPYTREAGPGFAWPLQGDDALVTPEWQTAGGEPVQLPASASETPEDGGFLGISINDPCILHNYREALRFLEGVAEVDPTGHTADDIYVYYAAGATSTAVPTKSALGIDVLTEDSLTRPQQVQPWAVLRDALTQLRYMRVVAQQSLGAGALGFMGQTGTVKQGEGFGAGPSGDNTQAAALTACNNAIGSAITNEDSGVAVGVTYLSGTVSASAEWASTYWLASAGTACLESTTLLFRVPGSAGVLGALPDLPVTRAEIRFADGGTVNERVTSAAVTVDGDADTITDGKEMSWSEEKDDVVIAFAGTRTSSIGSVVWNSGTSKWEGSRGFAFIVDRVGVNYDIESEPYPS